MSYRNLCRFFFYGTLRPGGVNHDLVSKYITDIDEDASLNGFAMHSVGAYPTLVPCDHSSMDVKGTLVTIAFDKLDAAMAVLDRLEGYATGRENNLFDRIVVKAKSNKHGEVSAWMYKGGKQYCQKFADHYNTTSHSTRIYHGDWNKHQASKVTNLYPSTRQFDFGD